MYGPLCPLLEMTRWQGMRRGTWQRQMDRGGGRKGKKNKLTPKDTSKLGSLLFCFFFFRKKHKIFLSPSQKYLKFQRFSFRFLCVTSILQIQEEACKTLSARGARVLNFDNVFSSAQITHRERCSFILRLTGFLKATQQLEVLIIGMYYALKQADLLANGVTWKPPKMRKKWMCILFYFSLSLSLSFYIHTLEENKVAQQKCLVWSSHQSTFRVMAQSLGINVFLLFNSVKQRSNQKLMGKNTSRMNIQSRGCQH